MTNIPAVLQPFGIDIFCLGKKFLVFNLVGRNLKIKYRRSVLGILWTLLAPLAMGGVYYLVFKVVLKVDIPHYVLFVLSGVLCWNFFSQSFLEGLESIVGHRNLITKIPLPLHVFPYVNALTNLITLLLAFPIILGIAIASGAPVGAPFLLFFFYAGLFFVFTYGCSLLAATLFVYVRDLRHLAQILIQIWFYATPVLYHEDMIPEAYRWALYLNPLGMFFVGLHKALAEATWPDALTLGVAAGWAFGILGLALAVQAGLRRTLVERI